MSLHNKKYLPVLSALLLSLALVLTSCGRGQTEPGSVAGETGESYIIRQEGLAPGTTTEENEQLSLQQQFEEFCLTVFREEMQDTDTLNRHYTLLNPESYGITPGEVTLGTYSLEEMYRDIRDTKKLQSRLSAFDRGELNADQQLVYDTLETSLKSALLGEGMELYEQPLAPTIGVQAQLPILLAEYSFYSLNDVEDYLSLLSQIDRYYQEIMTFEHQKADAGLAPSDESIDAIIKSCESYLIDPESNFLTETFETRMAALESKLSSPLTAEQKESLSTRHTTAIREHFIPAYQSLIDGMKELKGRGINEGGLSWLKDGKKYYEYLLASSAGLSYTVPELQSALLTRMEEDLAAMNGLFDAYPDLGKQISSASFSLTDPIEILEDLKVKMADDFPALANCKYEVRYVPKYLEKSLSPAFYLTAPLDNTDQNVIYINNGYSDSTSGLYTTLALEGFPGHLYQTVYERSHTTTPLLSILSCSAANEGWATYVENYVSTWDTGLPNGVGEYQALARSFSLCAHGLLDIGINYEGWTKEQASEFILTYFDADTDTINDLWQTMIDTPTNYLEYCGGYVEILEMQKEAKESLGDKFSMLKFHQFLLDIGPVPFSVTRDYSKTWLEGMSL